MQRLAISAAMAKRQKPTAILDTCGTWNGIGAAINVLWQQTKVVVTVDDICDIDIPDLHFRPAHHLIQFEGFNNIVTSHGVVPFILAWPLSSFDLTRIDWASDPPCRI